MSGRLAREDAFDAVMLNNSHWVTAALYAARSVPVGWTGIGEDLRLRLRAAGLRDPAHHNAWGALVMVMVRAGVLEDTGETRQMAVVTSHARKSSVYRKIK